MRNAFFVICLNLLLLTTGCATVTRGTNDANPLPSIKSNPQFQVVQVAANYQSDISRDHPYFILCMGEECPEITPKTPHDIFQLPVVQSKDPSRSTSTKGVGQKGRTINGENTTYLTKTSEVLVDYRIHFDYASADLNDAGQTRLYSFIRNFEHQRRLIRITGYTDSVSKPDGTIGNEWLALERATAVKDFLIDRGYPASQILLEAKFLCCYIATNETDEGRQKNRRAELTLININSKGE